MTNKFNFYFHIKEAKYRITYLIIGYSLLCTLFYMYSYELSYLLAKPLLNQSLTRNFIFTELTEAFLIFIKITLFLSFYFYFPIILYQFWAFLVPGLFKKEKQTLTTYFIYTIILFILGSLFNYYFIFPLTCNFFLSFEHFNLITNFNLSLEVRIYNYFSLIIKFIYLFGCLFQFPLYFFILLKSNIFNAKYVIKSRKFIVICFFIVAALISPPDVFSQLLIAGPLLLCYESSLWIYQIDIALIKKQKKL